MASENNREEYLTTKELSARIKIAQGTLRNYVSQQKFQENVHYIKPSKRKLLFLWSAIELWLHGKPVSQIDQSGSLINI